MAKKIRDTAIRSKETLLLYWQEIRKYKKSFFVGALCIPASSVFLDTATPYILSQAIGTLASSNADQLGQYLWLAGCTASAGVVLNLLGFQVIMRHEAHVRSGIARSSMKNLLLKDPNFFANQRIGALTGKFIDFVNGHVAIQDLLILRMATFVINMGLGIFLIWRQTPLLAVIVFVLIAILLVQVRISRYLRMSLRNQRKELVAEANGLAADIITNYATVKTFATETHELQSLDKINERYRKAYTKDFQWMSIEGTGRILLMQVAQITAIFIIGGLLLNRQIELGIAIFTIAYLQRLASQLFTLGEILFGYDKIMLQAAPMTDILLEQPRITDTTRHALRVSEGEVTFNSVTYAYQDDKQTHILDNFSLTIPSGQKVGLVGHSGAGKTTVTRLLLRFDDIDAGSITIDNQNIAHITQHSLRKHIAYVPQEPMLFHRSLRDNIAYADPNASETEVTEAVRQANALEFIMRLPQGLNTIVGERGVKLSGGQRQRVAIARALLKDAPILILDEATSALDSESEALIQQSLNTLMVNRTSIVVAHRLSTLRHMDRIIVMDSGQIVEDGTHAELLKQGGIYAALWKRQSGGFIEE